VICPLHFPKAIGEYNFLLLLVPKKISDRYKSNMVVVEDWFHIYKFFTILNQTKHHNHYTHEALPTSKTLISPTLLKGKTKRTLSSIWPPTKPSNPFL